MSQNCNKIARLSEAQLDAKAAAAKTATAALLQGMSECYKAAEVIHIGQSIERAAVYLRSASVRIEMADAALCRNTEILEAAPVETDALEWLRNLDYPRLYSDGVRDGSIPPNEMQWSALAEINRVEGYMGVADGLRQRLANLSHAIQVVADEVSEHTDEATKSLIALLTELNNVGAFAQMVAYVNRITPMDPRWSSPTVSVATARA